MDETQLTPLVVRVVPSPTQETSVADVLLGAVGFIGATIVAALVAGLLAGALFIAFRKLQARLSDRRGDETPSATHLTR
ncbi:MAG: hypothetical protein AB7I50_10450 [Vicinamibacterales bacterium]